MSSAGAVAVILSCGSWVKVGTSGKYPPPTESFLPCGDGSSGDTLSSWTAVYGKPFLGYGSYGAGEPLAET